MSVIVPLKRLNPVIMELVLLSGLSSTSTPLACRLRMRVSAATSSPVRDEQVDCYVKGRRERGVEVF